MNELSPTEEYKIRKQKFKGTFGNKNPPESKPGTLFQQAVKDYWDKKKEDNK